jgi:hypothetical protein
MLGAISKVARSLEFIRFFLCRAVIVANLVSRGCTLDFSSS